MDNYEHLVLISLYDETIPKTIGETGLLAIIQIMSGDGAKQWPRRSGRYPHYSCMVEEENKTISLPFIEHGKCIDLL